MDKCLNCQFYDRKDGRSTDGRSTMWGQCRRHSPLLNPQNAKVYVVEGVWPTVRDDDWCGEWRASVKTTLPHTRVINARDLMGVASAPAEPSGTARPMAEWPIAAAVTAGDD